MNEKETGKSPADIAGDIRVIETDISHIKGDISELKSDLRDGLKSQGKDIADLKSELETRGNDISGLRSELKARGDDIADLRSDLKNGLKAQGNETADLRADVAKLQLGQTEIKTMIEKILATLPDKVDKQGQKISWLFGLVAGLSLMVTIIAVVLRN